jgi:hypothetical protein
MRIEFLYKVPTQYGRPYFDLLGQEVLQFRYGDIEKWRAGLRFHGVAAIQMRSTKSLEEWQDESNFKLVEVFDSPWKESVLKAVDEQYAAYKGRKHHYAILDVDVGYEFLADSWELLPEKDGWGAGRPVY